MDTNEQIHQPDVTPPLNIFYETTSGTVPEVQEPNAAADDIGVGSALVNLPEVEKEAIATKLSDAELVAQMDQFVFAPPYGRRSSQSPWLRKA